MTFEELRNAIDKKRIVKNSKWEWAYLELKKLESECIYKQKVKDAIEKGYQIAEEKNSSVRIGCRLAFDYLKKELGI